MSLDWNIFYLIIIEPFDLITRKLNLSNYYQRFSIVYHCWKHFKKSNNNICILFIPQTPFNCGYYIHETSCKIFTINLLYNFDKSCKIAFIMSHKNRGTITCNWYTYSNGRVMFSEKNSSFMAGILIQSPFITKKLMCIIKKGQRPRSLEQ